LYYLKVCYEEVKNFNIERGRHGNRVKVVKKKIVALQLQDQEWREYRSDPTQKVLYRNCHGKVMGLRLKVL
jgi:hypothetical protein